MRRHLNPSILTADFIWNQLKAHDWEFNYTTNESTYNSQNSDELMWDKRKDWFTLGVFSSGVGLAVIGLFLPVFADDTVAIIWWGLAAVVVGSSWYKVDSKEQKKAIIKE